MAPFVIGESPKDALVWKVLSGRCYQEGAIRKALSNLKRFLDAVNTRPAAVRAEAIKVRHAFKTEFDEGAKRAMFRHIAA
jgi:hypothetical protein